MKNLQDVTLFTADTKPLIQQKSLYQLLQNLPVALHARALRYKSEKSAYNYVIGRLLLKEGLSALDLRDRLEDIKLVANGKPVLPNIDFNISHSDNQIICAFSKKGPIGVDLEKIKAIDFNDFTSVFTSHELSSIRQSDKPLHTFYWFWTRKESIIKALGLTLSYLHQIELDVSSDKFVIDGTTWFLKELNLGDDYVGMICSAVEIGEVDYANVIF